MRCTAKAPWNPSRKRSTEVRTEARPSRGEQRSICPNPNCLEYGAPFTYISPPPVSPPQVSGTGASTEARTIRMSDSSTKLATLQCDLVCRLTFEKYGQKKRYAPVNQISTNATPQGRNSQSLRLS